MRLHFITRGWLKNVQKSYYTFKTFQSLRAENSVHFIVTKTTQKMKLNSASAYKKGQFTDFPIQSIPNFRMYVTHEWKKTLSRIEKTQWDKEFCWTERRSAKMKRNDSWFKTPLENDIVLEPGLAF